MLYLERIDGIYLGDNDPAAEASKRLGTAFANIAITRHASNLKVDSTSQFCTVENMQSVTNRTSI